MTIKTVTRRRHSIIRIDDLNSRKKQGLVRGVYGVLLVGTSIFLMALDPVKVVTDWFLRMEEGSFIFNMWQEPPYELYLDVYAFNYTNVEQFLSGEHSKLKLQEVGPFKFQEKRTNHNMTVDEARERLTMIPHIDLTALPEKSVSDSKETRIIVPNLALIVLSTLATDILPWWSNKLANQLMRGMGAKLFLNLTVDEYLWGYHDPLVEIANTLAPGWIDFASIGILDRFYDRKSMEVKMEVELSNRNNNKYSIISFDGSPGLKEQGFKDVNSSIPCNLIAGSYEGLMLSPGLTHDTKVRLFRKQACRVYPLSFVQQNNTKDGFTFYRYGLEESSFSRSSEFACKCREPCVPEGFIDISKCFYNFPVALTKPHYLDADPREMERYEGLHPDREKHTTFMDFEPTLSVPVKLQSSVQANLAVRTSPFNPITMPVNNHFLPLMWVSMYCDTLPDSVASLLKLRLLYGPPGVVVMEILVLSVGLWLLGTGLYRYFVPAREMRNAQTKEEYEKVNEALLLEEPLELINISYTETEIPQGSSEDPWSSASDYTKLYVEKGTGNNYKNSERKVH